MVRHNLTLSLRLFTRNRFYAVTSIIGLSFGLTIAILISLYVRFELSFEQNNPLSERIVRVTMDYLNGDAVIDQDAGTYRPAGPRILAEFKGVENFARAFPVSNTTIKAGNESFRENSMFAVDPSFLTMFNCAVLAGSNDMLTQPYEVVLTESAAVKYFGRTDVLGESIQMSWFDQPFKVTGLIADAPANTHIKYSVLISQATYEKKYHEARWDNNDQYTYVLLSDPSQYSAFNEQLNALNKSLHAEGNILNERIVAQPLNDIHLYSHKGYELEQSGDPFAVYFLMGIAILVLCIAIVNHINLSTAKSLERAKEVGVRKVIGSSLTQLRIQFFTESLVINIVSTVFAAVLVTAFLPAFQEMAGLPANVHTLMDTDFYLIVLAGVLATSILSSIFPSLILSGFHPMKALKGKFSRSAGGVNLRKALVVVQFSITMFLLVQTFTASRQLNYMRTKDLGLDIEQTIVVRTAASGEGNNYQVFKDRLQGQTDVQSVSYSGCVPGMPTSEMGSTNVGVTVVGGAKAESFNFYVTFVDADFIKTMKMNLTAGSDFVASDRDQNKILVNEEAIRLWNLDAKAAIGQKINLWGAQREIVGVIKNFHQTSPREAFLPMIMFHQEGNNKLASVRVKPGDLTKEISLIKDAFESVFPGSPFEYFFLDQEFDRQYRADEQFGQVFQTLTTFALLISALGLFGLVSVAVANRTKEIGIRKVLGASAQQILSLISRDFVGLVLVSVVVSTTFTYFVVSQWVERYAFRIDLEPDLFILPALFIVGLSVITVAARALRAATVNPVDSLKEE
jgi:putative ABC transport system permease protein